MLAIRIARWLFGLFFLGSAILKVVETEALADMLRAVGFLAAEPMVYMAAFAQALGGGALLLGYNVREAAIGLILYVGIVNYVLHAFWTLEGAEAAIQFQLFSKNVGIMTGLLAIAGVHWRDHPSRRTGLPGEGGEARA